MKIQLDTQKLLGFRVATNGAMVGGSKVLLGLIKVT